LGLPNNHNPQFSQGKSFDQETSRSDLVSARSQGSNEDQINTLLAYLGWYIFCVDSTRISNLIDAQLNSSFCYQDTRIDPAGSFFLFKDMRLTRQEGAPLAGAAKLFDVSYYLWKSCILSKSMG
jgi:hypothetical protein